MRSHLNKFLFFSSARAGGLRPYSPRLQPAGFLEICCACFAIWAIAALSGAGVQPAQAGFVRVASGLQPAGFLEICCACFAIRAIAALSGVGVQPAQAGFVRIAPGFSLRVFWRFVAPVLPSGRSPLYPVRGSRLPSLTTINTQYFPLDH